MSHIIATAVMFKVANLVPFDGLRTRLYRATGMRIARDVFIGEDVLFDKLHPSAISIGAHTAIGARTIITAHQVVPTETDLREPGQSQQFRNLVEQVFLESCPHVTKVDF